MEEEEEDMLFRGFGFFFLGLMWMEGCGWRDAVGLGSCVRV